MGAIKVYADAAPKYWKPKGRGPRQYMGYYQVGVVIGDEYFVRRFRDCPTQPIAEVYACLAALGIAIDKGYTDITIGTNLGVWDHATRKMHQIKWGMEQLAKDNNVKFRMVHSVNNPADKISRQP